MFILIKTVQELHFWIFQPVNFLLPKVILNILINCLKSFQPKEVLTKKPVIRNLIEYFGNKFYTYKLDDWVFTFENSENRLLKTFSDYIIKRIWCAGLSLRELLLPVLSCNIWKLPNIIQIEHITTIARIEEDRYVWLDKFTVRNLELFQPIHEGGKTLLDVIDQTNSPMGARMLRRWLAMPLKEIQPIEERS